MSNCFVCLQNVTDPSGYHPKCAKSLFGSKTVPTLDIELAKLHTAALAMVGKISISGIQKKISLNISVDRKTLYVAAGKSYYILKPPTETYPFLPENEHVTMLLAKLSGLRVEECGLIRIDGNKLAFITKRFDRRIDGSKVHQEDFCQLAEMSPSEKYDGSGERCAKIIKQFASEPGIELLRLFEQLVFAWWIGNGDLHLKNLSVMVDLDGLVKLTPAYDLVSTVLVIPNDPLALPICGRDRNFQRSTWQKFAAYCGIGDKAALRVLDRQAKCLAKAQTLIKQSYLPKDMQDHLVAIIEERSTVLESQA
jgi:serine/threonine-protein kinase HipA